MLVTLKNVPTFSAWRLTDVRETEEGCSYLVFDEEQSIICHSSTLPDGLEKGWWLIRNSEIGNRYTWLSGREFRKSYRVKPASRVRKAQAPGIRISTEPD